MTEETKNIEVEIPLADTFDLVVGDDELKLKMTWDNLSRCARYAESHIHQFNIYQIDCEVQSKLIDLIVQEVDEKGNHLITDKCVRMKNNMSMEVAMGLYTWVGEHINNFFIRKLLNAKMIKEKYSQILENRETFLKKQEEISSNNEEKKD